MNRRETCPGCGKTGVVVFFEMPAVPVLVNFLYRTRERAVECSRGDIALGFCQGCGFISNFAFDPLKLVYEEGYENPLHYSEVFRTYSYRLAQDLVQRFGLHGKKLVEIGCGDGDFLRLLCELGGNRGVGFDPSYPASLPTRHERFEIVRDSYSEEYAGLRADFVCSRHTLEHVRDPSSLLGPLRRSIADRTAVAVYLEVPNASYTLRNRFVWDIIYEHPSYFTGPALSNAMEMSGFRVDRIYEAFSGQYLCAEGTVGVGAKRGDRGSSASAMGAQPPDGRSGRAGTPCEKVREEVQRFASSYNEYVELWRARLEELRAAGRTCAVWGAGSKGITFLNAFDVGAVVDCVVDINPKKQGRFVAGKGHAIVAPEHLKRARPDAVVVANPVYRVEVEETLRGMGLAPEVITL